MRFDGNLVHDLLVRNDEGGREGRKRQYICELHDCSDVGDGLGREMGKDEEEESKGNTIGRRIDTRGKAASVALMLTTFGARGN